MLWVPYRRPASALFQTLFRFFFVSSLNGSFGRFRQRLNFLKIGLCRLHLE